MIEKFQIKKIQDNGESFKFEDDFLAEEEPLEISLKTKVAEGILPLSVTMRTSGNDRELAVGFLLTEGIIHSKSNLSDKISVQLEENKIIIELTLDFNPNLESLKRNFYTTSSCGICGKESIEAVRQVCKPLSNQDYSVDWRVISSLPEKLRTHQKTFQKTGGIHASALFDLEGNLMTIREDIGRHNALDKLIGYEFLQSQKETFSLDKNILLLSGRASFELIQKSAIAGIPIVCSIGAPSSLAVKMAEELGITLIGFLKNGNGNIYTNHEKIVI